MFQCPATISACMAQQIAECFITCISIKARMAAWIAAGFNMHTWLCALQPCYVCALSTKVVARILYHVHSVCFSFCAPSIYCPKQALLRKNLRPQNSVGMQVKLSVSKFLSLYPSASLQHHRLNMNCISLQQQNIVNLVTQWQASIPSVLWGSPAA